MRFVRSSSSSSGMIGAALSTTESKFTYNKVRTEGWSKNTVYKEVFSSHLTFCEHHFSIFDAKNIGYELMDKDNFLNPQPLRLNWNCKHLQLKLLQGEEKLFLQESTWSSGDRQRLTGLV